MYTEREGERYRSTLFPKIPVFTILNKWRFLFFSSVFQSKSHSSSQNKLFYQTACSFDHSHLHLSLSSDLDHRRFWMLVWGKLSECSNFCCSFKESFAKLYHLRELRVKEAIFLLLPFRHATNFSGFSASLSSTT